MIVLFETLFIIFGIYVIRDLIKQTNGISDKR